jgi:RNA polymerase sigma-70 factor (ECF subfamily)
VRSDPGPFETTFDAHWRAVSRYVARRVAPEAVQDVVSETFLVAWRRYDELNGEPLPWLLGIARRVAANQRRSGARRRALLERLHGVAAAERRSDVLPGDRRLAAAWALLGERDREALMLVAWDGLDHRDAATVMGCSTSAFTVRLHRARRRLAGLLGRDEKGAIELPAQAESLT